MVYGVALAGRGGVTNVRRRPLGSTTTCVGCEPAPLIVTVADGENRVPMSSTVVPPAVVPRDGVRAVMVTDCASAVAAPAATRVSAATSVRMPVMSILLLRGPPAGALTLFRRHRFAKRNPHAEGNDGEAPNERRRAGRRVCRMVDTGRTRRQEPRVSARKRKKGAAVRLRPFSVYPSPPAVTRRRSSR